MQKFSLISIWWDCSGIIHFDLPVGEGITAKKYWAKSNISIRLFKKTFDFGKSKKCHFPLRQCKKEKKPCGSLNSWNGEHKTYSPNCHVFISHYRKKINNKNLTLLSVEIYLNIFLTKIRHENSTKKLFGRRERIAKAIETIYVTKNVIVLYLKFRF